ncbi:TPA: DUF421 domain-containing protein [bacterium]|nr:DUF421 domain-containing protein [bacterium]
MRYVDLIIKTLVFLTSLWFFLRIMGKREVGQLNAFDIVVFFMLSDIFSVAIEDPDKKIMEALVPIMVIVLTQLTISLLVLKSNKIRTFLEQDPAFIIKNGKIDQKLMKKERYNVDDLMQQLRISGVDSISDVKFAVLENSGVLSVIQKGKEKTLVPFPIIRDGEIDKVVLKQSEKDEQWVKKEIKKQGYLDVSEIYICIIEKDDKLLIIPKAKEIK